MVVCDAVLRKLPGALGHEDSAVEESFSARARGRRPSTPTTRGRRSIAAGGSPRCCSRATTRGSANGAWSRAQVARASPVRYHRPPARAGPRAVRAKPSKPTALTVAAGASALAMSTVIDSLERAQLRRVPTFDAGDRLRVHFQVIEGTRRRTQVFEGVVIKRQGHGARETFTVRKQSFGVGVERTFPLHSPKIERIEVAARGDVRRAKLYYLRDRVGKRARVRERRSNRPEEVVERELLYGPEVEEPELDAEPGTRRGSIGTDMDQPEATGGRGRRGRGGRRRTLMAQTHQRQGVQPEAEQPEAEDSADSAPPTAAQDPGPAAEEASRRRREGVTQAKKSLTSSPGRARRDRRDRARSGARGSRRSSSSRTGFRAARCCRRCTSTSGSWSTGSGAISARRRSATSSSSIRRRTTRTAAPIRTRARIKPVRTPSRPCDVAQIAALFGDVRQARGRPAGRPDLDRQRPRDPQRRPREGLLHRPVHGAAACTFPGTITIPRGRLLHDGRQPARLGRQPLLGAGAQVVDHRQGILHLLATGSDRLPVGDDVAQPDTKTSKSGAQVGDRAGRHGRDRGRAGAADPGVHRQALPDPEPVDGPDAPDRPADPDQSPDQPPERRRHRRLPSAHRRRSGDAGLRQPQPGRRARSGVRHANAAASRARRSSSASSAGRATGSRSSTAT